MSFAVSTRPCRGGDRGGVSDIKEGDGRCRVWTKKLTPPLPLSLTPIPSPKGEGTLSAGSRVSGRIVYIFFLFVSLSIVSKSIVGLCPTRKQFQ